MEPSWVRKSKNGTTVIFVHGILSSTVGCWLASSGAFWPRLLSEEQSIDDVGIYLFEYRADAFSGTYSLDDAVDAMREYFKLEGLWSEKQLIFVGHSMGGIVARRFLIAQQQRIISSHIHVGLFLIASPSLGADYANFASAIAPIYNLQLDLLRFSQDNAWLNALDKDFINLKEGGAVEIFGKELVEDKFLVAKKLLGLPQVVPPWSGAKYFGEPIRIAYSDHLSIAKPTSPKALQHRILVDFVRSALASTNQAPSAQPTTLNPILIDWLLFTDAPSAPSTILKSSPKHLARFFSYGIIAVAMVAAILWGAMWIWKQRESQHVETIYAGLVDAQHLAEIERFNGGHPGMIKPCPSMNGWPTVPAPRDPKTGEGMERFVDPVFWAAESLGVGSVAQCYEMAPELPALVVDGNNSNYRIIATVRIFFNKVPADVAFGKRAEWISGESAAAFSKDSVPIAVYQYKTARHYSTYFGTTVGVFSHAWGSPPLNVHDVYECRMGGAAGVVVFDPNCKAGPDADSPVQALVTKSVDVDPEGGRKTKAAVEMLVRDAIEQRAPQFINGLMDRS